MDRRPATAALAAFACLCGLALTGLVALVLPVAQVRDSTTLHGFIALSGTRVGGVAPWVAHLVDPVPYAVGAVVLALTALLRGRPRLALLVPVSMLGASATTELLKPLVAQPRFSEWLGAGNHILLASWPSGHATASMMVALCSVLVVPPALRPLAALLGTTLAVGVSYSILVLGWHFPSDVLGGFLVGGVWTSAAVAVLWWADERWPTASAVATTRRRSGRVLAPAALVPLVAGGGIAALLLRGRLAETYALQSFSFVAGAGAIAVLAAGLASAVTLALSGRRRAPKAARSRPQPHARG